MIFWNLASVGRYVIPRQVSLCFATRASPIGHDMSGVEQCPIAIAQLDRRRTQFAMTKLEARHMLPIRPASMDV
jgi:hypothetical protein